MSGARHPQALPKPTVVPQEAMVRCHELGVSCACPQWVTLCPSPPSLQLLDVLKAACKRHPGPGGSFCLGLEASASVLSEALSKCLTLPLGERVFIFLNFQQTDTEASPGKTCLLPQPPKKQVGVVAWRGQSFPWGEQPKQVPSKKPASWKNLVPANSLLRSPYLTSSDACS